MNKIKNIIRNIKLIHRYPFLKIKYRHQWEWINNGLYNYHHKAYYHISVSGTYYKNSDDSSIDGYVKDSKILSHNRYEIIYNSDTNTIDVTDTIIPNNSIQFDCSHFKWKDKFQIMGIKISYMKNLSGRFFINVGVTSIDNDTTDYGFIHYQKEIIYDTKALKKYKFFKWLDKIIYKPTLPTYTKFDEIPEGWRNAFGLQMCEDIREALLNEGGKELLNSYQIMQIKEKFGTLRWYDLSAPKSVHDIIDKYEALSYHTCVNCGKPATKISTGWICPYCDDCIGDKKYTDIE